MTNQHNGCDKWPMRDEHGNPKWVRVSSIDEMQQFFLSRLDAIRQAGREHGYAIGLHGSTRRDLDLMAMPWSDGCSDVDTLAKAIQLAACGIGVASVRWERKPNGRVATSLPICWTPCDGEFKDKLSIGCIDLSVMPVHQPADSEWRVPTEVTDDLDLPVPRLQLMCTQKVPGSWNDQEWVYSLVYKHFLGHVVSLPLGKTTRTVFCDGTPDPSDTPLRDGAHIRSDGRELNLPTYSVVAVEKDGYSTGFYYVKLEQ